MRPDAARQVILGALCCSVGLQVGEGACTLEMAPDPALGREKQAWPPQRHQDWGCRQGFVAYHRIRWGARALATGSTAAMVQRSVPLQLGLLLLRLVEAVAALEQEAVKPLGLFFSQQKKRRPSE